MEVILHHLEGEGSHRLFGIVVCGEFVCSPPFVYLFNHEFISVWTRIFISSLGFWSSNTSLCCSNCFGFGSWTLSYLAPLFLAMPHHFCFKHIFIFWHHKVLLVHFRYSCPIPRISPLSRDPLLMYFWVTYSRGWLPTFLRGFPIQKVCFCTPCNLYFKLEDSNLLQKYAENLCNHLCIVC